MKALLSRLAGGPETLTLEEVAEPIAGKGEVRVTVRACSVNFPALRAIGWEGRHLVVGFPAGIPKLPLNLTLLKGCQVIGVFWGEFTRRFPDVHQQNVATLMRLYLEGRIKPAVTARYPLAQGAEALVALESRAARGKVVVTVGA